LRHNAVFISATNWAAVFYDRFDLSLQAFHEDYRDTSKPLKAFICVIKDGARQKKLMPKVDCCATARFLRRCQNCYGFMVALIFLLQALSEDFRVTQRISEAFICVM
jgi:hypothetical protein